MTQVQNRQLKQIKKIIDEKIDFIEIDSKAQLTVNLHLKKLIRDFGYDEYNRVVGHFDLGAFGYKFL